MSTALVPAATIAKMLGVKSGTILRLARDGTIPSVRITPRLVRFDPVAVRESLNNQDSTAEPREHAVNHPADDFAHFGRLVAAGRLSGVRARASERQAAALARCVVDKVPGLDARARTGLATLVELAAREPDKALVWLLAGCKGC